MSEAAQPTGRNKKAIRRGLPKTAEDLHPRKESDGFGLLLEAKAAGRPVSAKGLSNTEFCKLITG